MKIVNSFTKALPIEENTDKRSRQVRGVGCSIVYPLVFSSPKLIHLSKDVLQMIGWDNLDDKTLLSYISGQKVPRDFQPYAMCYGGHQFGYWAGQLGDGRAITIAEIIHQYRFFTVQLKGVGQTPYSRGADGFAVLRSSIREYLCSEAMHALGVPTTRALSLVLSGEKVVRDELYDGNPKEEWGAIVARVAPSFIRFGNFEIFSARRDIKNLKQLADYTIAKFYPEIQGNTKEGYLDFFEAVVKRTKTLIMEWQRIGFVHGVMNTDNMSVLGLTIDYGPYGWLEEYNLNWTPNITDAEGRRYSFGNQYSIILWNLTQFANALFPLIEDVEALKKILRQFKVQYQEEYQTMMLRKLGIENTQKGDFTLIEELKFNLENSKMDMTLFFRNLNKFDKNNSLLHLKYLADNSYLSNKDFIKQKEVWGKWIEKYALRIKDINETERIKIINSTNPKYILRNYMAQMAIKQTEKGDYSLIDTFYSLLKHPYEEQKEHEQWFAKRPKWADNEIGSTMLSCSS